MGDVSCAELRDSWDEDEGCASMLMIVWHSRTGACEAMASAAFAGAGGAGAGRAQLVRADLADAEMLLAADGYLFCCPENLGTMSGAMKEMFDRGYYPLLGKVEGRPYASIIAAGSDGQGAQHQLDRIATGWRLRRIAEPIIVNFMAQTPTEILAHKTISLENSILCQDLGAAMAEGIATGIF